MSEWGGDSPQQSQDMVIGTTETNERLNHDGRAPSLTPLAPSNGLPGPSWSESEHFGYLSKDTSLGSLKSPALQHHSIPAAAPCSGNTEPACMRPNESYGQHHKFGPSNSLCPTTVNDTSFPSQSPLASGGLSRVLFEAERKRCSSGADLPNARPELLPLYDGIVDQRPRLNAWSHMLPTVAGNMLNLGNKSPMDGQFPRRVTHSSALVQSQDSMTTEVGKVEFSAGTAASGPYNLTDATFRSGLGGGVMGIADAGGHFGRLYDVPPVYSGQHSRFGAGLPYSGNEDIDYGFGDSAVCHPDCGEYSRGAGFGNHHSAYPDDEENLGSRGRQSEYVAPSYSDHPTTPPQPRLEPSAYPELESPTVWPTLQGAGTLTPLLLTETFHDGSSLEYEVSNSVTDNTYSNMNSLYGRLASY
jgi:hypothetical protein